MTRKERIERMQNMLGQRFGRLTVVEITETISAANNKIYGLKCLCDCGNISTPTEEKLRKGDTLSCGCLRREKLRREFFARRGKKKTGEMTMDDWK